MTIQNIEEFIESLPDWAMLDGCFGNTRIKPSDGDGKVERNGWVLDLEHKGPTAEIKTGQRIQFEAIARTGGRVIVFWGQGWDVQEMQIFDRVSGTGRIPAALGDLRDAVADWFTAADSCRRPDGPSVDQLRLTGVPLSGEPEVRALAV